ncbi:MAG: hypothetical protein LH629_09115, partial [Ignavibacteria bacterium]|nr:hypothetical protein [Ignavibacteria bacterium]
MKKQLQFILLFAISYLLFPISSIAQSAFQPLGGNAYNMIDRYEIKSGRFLNNIHTTDKPYLREDVVKTLSMLDTMKSKPKWTGIDTANMRWLRDDNSEWAGAKFGKSKKKVLTYFYQQKANLYSYSDGDFMIKIDPVIQFGYGYDRNYNEGIKFINSRGAEVRGWISKKLGFYFYLSENQFRPAKYVQTFINKRSGIPGGGYYKLFKPSNTETGYDYFNGRGYFDFKVLKFITITFGVDKNFIGNGYRSLFLSDFSNDYLYLKLSTKIWK